MKNKYYKAKRVIRADGETNMGRSIEILKIMISNSRVGKKILKKSLYPCFCLNVYNVD